MTGLVVKDTVWLRALRIVTAVMGLGLSSVQLTGCDSAPDPSRIGVFASSNHGLLELTTYGKQTGMTQYEMPNIESVLTASSVRSFYVNMPGSTITESKLYWLTGISKAFNETDQHPLNFNLVATKGNLYRVECADLARRTGGYAVLKINMPLGQPDRLYVVHVTE